MSIELRLDFFVEAQFFWTGRFPSDLLDEIGRQKNEIYQSLRPDPERPDLLTGSKVVAVAGVRFDVLFCSNWRQVDQASNKRVLQIINIDKLH